MGSAYPPQRQRSEPGADQSDPFLPEFTWEHVELALTHLASNDTKRQAIQAEIAVLKASAHPSMTGLLLSLFHLAIQMADAQVSYMPLARSGEALMT